MNSESPFENLFHALTQRRNLNENAMGTVAVLMTETLRYRDRLKEKTGYVLTVQDTREALDALEFHLDGRALPLHLTPEQSGLATIFIGRLTSYS